MALFYLKDFVTYNSVNDLVAASWQIATDENFEHIVDETIFDTDNVLTWRSESPYLYGKGENGHDIPLYVRVKLYTNNGKETFESDWFIAKEIPHKNNVETLTYKGKDVAKIKLNNDGTYETIL